MFSRSLSRRAGDRSPTATTPSSAWPPGTGRKMGPGAMPRTGVDTSPAAPSSRTRSNIFLPTRYLRVLMTESSNTCDEHGSDDVRNCLGYAIQQIAAGTMDTSGAFVEALKDPNEKRTTYCVSSIDPWHSSDDVNDSGNYQHSG